MKKLLLSIWDDILDCYLKSIGWTYKYKWITNPIIWARITFDLQGSLQLSIFAGNCNNEQYCFGNWYARAFFSHLLRAVSASSALFEKYIAVFSVKTFKTTYRLGGCSIPNALDFQKLGGKIIIVPFSWTFLPFFRYTARMPLFSRINLVCYSKFEINLQFN